MALTICVQWFNIGCGVSTHHKQGYWRLEVPRNSHLSTSPPYAVEEAVRRLGANLRTARLRRNLTMSDLASKIGVDRHVVGDAEGGKLTTGVAVYAGLLWAMDMLGPMDARADPRSDSEGLALARDGERARARSGGGLSDDF